MGIFRIVLDVLGALGSVADAIVTSMDIKAKKKKKDTNETE